MRRSASDFGLHLELGGLKLSIADNKSSPEKPSTEGKPSAADRPQPEAGKAPGKSGGEQRNANVHVLRAGNEDIVVGDNSSLEGSFDTNGSMFVGLSCAPTSCRSVPRGMSKGKPRFSARKLLVSSKDR